MREVTWRKLPACSSEQARRGASFQLAGRSRNSGGPVDPRRLDVVQLEGCLAARVVHDELRGLFVGGRGTAESGVAALGSAHEPRFDAISLEDFFIELAEGRQ